MLENVEDTKKQLEMKVIEMQELVRSLGEVICFSPQGIFLHLLSRNISLKCFDHVETLIQTWLNIAKPPPKKRAYIVSPEQRTWKSGLSFSDVVGGEGSLPAISEDARSRRGSLNVDEQRRMSLDNDSRKNSPQVDETRRNVE